MAKVFVTDYAYQADIKVFPAKHNYQAKCNHCHK